MPHDPEATRYRIYVLRDGEPREVCSTSRDGIGLALVTCFDEGEWGNDDRVGILDRLDDGERVRTGTWIVNPWAVGDGR